MVITESITNLFSKSYIEVGKGTDNSERCFCLKYFCERKHQKICTFSVARWHLFDKFLFINFVFSILFVKFLFLLKLRILIHTILTT